MPVQTRIQSRRDTAANWTSTNPVLSAGEFGYETDTTKLKVGNGSSAWTALGYISASQTTANVSSGLVYITSGSLSITNAAPLNLDNVFTSTYDNYLLTTQNLTSAVGTTSVILQWRVGGATTTSGYFVAYQGYTSAGATYNANNNGSAVGIDIGLAETAAGSGSSVINIMTPKTTGQAAAWGQMFAQGPGYYVNRNGGGALNAGTDFDGITLRASASTITGSYILYGYRK